MIGLGIIMIGAPLAGWVLVKFLNRRDAARVARKLPPSKRLLTEDRELPNYVK